MRMDGWLGGGGVFVCWNVCWNFEVRRRTPGSELWDMR